MATPMKLVLFEDTEDTRSSILGSLSNNLFREEEVVLFDAEQFKEAAEDKTRMYEDRIESILQHPPYDDATLLVVDRDLSKSIDFRGLSVNAVAEAAGRLARPVCSYARQPGAVEYHWRGRWEEGHIVLDVSEGVEGLARRAAIAGRGFAFIMREVATRNIRASESPAKLLAGLLGKADYVEKIGLYGVGDQNRLSEVLKKPGADDLSTRRLACFLGYWLWDSLLRYPGLFVNEIAAASYLNLSPGDFSDIRVRSVFEDAVYQGPFSDPKRPQWWRGTLDDILSRENSSDGLTLVREKVKPEAKRSECYVDPTKSAGYYCIIAEKPVSFENSKGGIGWFPRGADLTRIGIPRLEELGPWGLSDS